MVVRKFHPNVRLRALLATPGGITASQALAAAGVELEVVRDQTMAAVDEKLDRMSAWLKAPHDGEFDAAVHRLSNDVMNEGGAFGLTELANAAHSLCVFLDSGVRTPSRLKIIGVHVDAMRALRQPAVSGDASARAAVQRGLHDVVKRFAADDEAAKQRA